MVNSTEISDPFGIYGTLFHYGLVFALVGSALVIFLYLWKKGKLDMDEQPKFQMMEKDE